MYRIIPLVVATALAIGAGPQEPRPSGIRFVLAEDAGIDFVHEHGGQGLKHLPETMGGGIAWLDYDRDGHYDLYVVDSGPLPESDPVTSTEVPATGSVRAALAAGLREPGHNGLYRNRGDGAFDLALGTGADDPGYSQGLTVADYDSDGWTDVLVTNWGPNILYRNNGDGTFSPLLGTGIEDPQWSVSASWGDLDLDGFPDLYVTNYLVYDYENPRFCGDGSGENSYCHINLFEGIEDSLMHNLGDGYSFVDVARDAGIANATDGKGLGVVMGDLDDDGLQDIYVANDTAMNFYLLNRGNMQFENMGLMTGTGFSEDGKAQAGMGTLIADLDGDESMEILVANFAFEPVNVYRPMAPGMYMDESFALGIGEATLATLGFGMVAEDLDGDGDRDFAVANGHILDDVDRIKDNTSYPQRNQIFRSHLTDLRARAIHSGEISSSPATSGGSGNWKPWGTLFEEITSQAGSGFDPVEVSRGMVAGDADADGRPDLALANNAGPARLLLNRTENGGRRLVLRLRGRAASRDAFGARAIITPHGGDAALDGADGFPQRFEVRSASSYCSQGATDLFVGLGESPSATIEVRWPGGTTETFDVDAGEVPRLLLIDEGLGIVATRDLRALEESTR